MTLNQKLIAALAPFGDPVVPELYTGTAPRWYTFNYDLLPITADNRPILYRALIQVHYFCPLNENSLQRRVRTSNALAFAGCTWPNEVNASGNERMQDETNPCQHFVFECEAVVPVERN